MSRIFRCPPWTSICGDDIPSLIRINLTTELLARASSLNGVRKSSEDLLEDISVLSLL